MREKRSISNRRRVDPYSSAQNSLSLLELASYIYFAFAFFVKGLYNL